MTGSQQGLLICGGLVILVWAIGAYIGWRDNHPRPTPAWKYWRCAVCGMQNQQKYTTCQRSTFGEVGYDNRKSGYDGVIHGERPACKGRKP